MTIEEKRKLRVTIIGSFKFKEQIDLAREEFEDNGVEVLDPDKGGIASSPRERHVHIPTSFRPLTTEVGRTPGQVEDRFLGNVLRSDLVYIVNPDGYAGDVSSMETGFAIGMGIPTYQMSVPDESLDVDPEWQKIVKLIPVRSIPDAISDVKSGDGGNVFVRTVVKW